MANGESNLRMVQERRADFVTLLVQKNDPQPAERGCSPFLRSVSSFREQADAPRDDHTAERIPGPRPPIFKFSYRKHSLWVRLVFRNCAIKLISSDMCSSSWRSPTYDNSDVKQLFHGFEEFGKINQTPEALLLDVFPILRGLPDWIVRMKTRAKRLHHLEKPLYLRLWLNAKDSTENGNARPCFCVNVAKVQGQEGFSDDQAAYIAGTVLEAGSDTTSNSLYAFIQALVVFPEVQKKAQEAIDRVCSEDKLPTMEDEPNLQYIRACIKETLRWMPTAPTGGVPHAVTEDDHYMGYTIPKGAGIMISTWSIHMNSDRYPKPRQFNPDRFKGDSQTATEAAANPNVSKRDHFAFGAGRRICPGMHVTERSLFLGMSRLLWAFDFQPKVDAESKPIIPDIENLTQGFVVRPEEFPAVIRPRSQKRAEVLELPIT